MIVFLNADMHNIRTMEFCTCHDWKKLCIYFALCIETVVEYY